MCQRGAVVGWGDCAVVERVCWERCWFGSVDVVVTVLMSECRTAYRGQVVIA